MEKELTVGQVMAPIEEYNTVAAEAPLCDALFILKANLKRIESGEKGPLHKTLLAVDPSGQIIGMLSIFDLIRGLVPERAKEPAVSRTFYRSLSDRQLNVADEIGKLKERFDWLDHTFLDLVKTETQKKVKEVMSPIHPLLEESDSPQQGRVRHVQGEHPPAPGGPRRPDRGGINIMDIFPVLLALAGMTV